MKRCPRSRKKHGSDVAPFTGAWIETSEAVIVIVSSEVAPFTGAWIETPKEENGKELV